MDGTLFGLSLADFFMRKPRNCLGDASSSIWTISLVDRYSVYLENNYRVVGRGKQQQKNAGTSLGIHIKTNRELIIS